MSWVSRWFALLVLPLLAASCSTAAAAELSVPDSPAALPEPALPEPQELERQGAIIGEIFVYPENIFDVQDPREDRRLYRLANSLHVTTQPRIIREQLLFKSGDLYSSRALEESERILRSARYLYDADIRVVGYKDGRVDVAVKTRDVWTLNPGVSFSRHGGENSTGFEVEELNFLGTGTDVSVAQHSDVDRDSTLIEYKDRHLLGSWINMQASYADSSDGSLQSLILNRPFYALDTRWAAAMSGQRYERTESLYDLGEKVDDYRANTRFASASWGWSPGLRNGWTKRWTVGATFDDNDFEPPVGAATTNMIPDDRTLVYPWIGFELIQDDFAKLRNHDQIGRTEDFYLGAHLSAMLGYASESFGSDRNALIFSANASHGSGDADRSTLLLSAGIKGRVESGSLRNTVFDGAARYYVKQSEKRLFFTTLEASVGRALDLDTQIMLGGDTGLRGYPLRYQAGESRALLTMEQRYFTDWYPFRLFRVGAAAFFDIGRTWGQTTYGTPSQGLLKDVGIGLRFGNSRSGLGNIIHVDLAFPLDGDSSIENTQILVETKHRF
jgi:outer membrane protein assembly factor BamA